MEDKYVDTKTQMGFAGGGLIAGFLSIDAFYLASNRAGCTFAPGQPHRSSNTYHGDNGTDAPCCSLYADPYAGGCVIPTDAGNL